MVFVGHCSAFPDLLQLLRLLGFLCWTSWAVGRIADVGTAGQLLHPGGILGSDRWFWRLSQATYWIFVKIALLGRGLLTSLRAGKPQPKSCLLTVMPFAQEPAVMPAGKGEVKPGCR